MIWIVIYIIVGISYGMFMFVHYYEYKNYAEKKGDTALKVSIISGILWPIILPLSFFVKFLG